MTEIRVKPKLKTVSSKKAPIKIHARPKADAMTTSFCGLVNASIEKNQREGHPIAKYDAKLGKAYLLYPDGTIDYES